MAHTGHPDPRRADHTPETRARDHHRAEGVTILERITSPFGGTSRRPLDTGASTTTARSARGQSLQYRGATLEPVAPPPGRLWRSRASGNGRPDTDAASTVGDIETSPCREEKHGSAWTQNKFQPGVPVGTLRHWRHSDIGPASFTLGRRVVWRDEVSRWISKREAQLDVELAPGELRDRNARVIASTSRFSAKETIDTVPTSRYALRTPLAPQRRGYNQPASPGRRYARSGWATYSSLIPVG